MNAAFPSASRAPASADSPHTATAPLMQTTAGGGQESSGNPLVRLASEVAAALGVGAFPVLAAFTALAALVLYRVVLRPVVAAVAGGGGIAGSGKLRHTVLLIGLPSSGKTVLLQQLQAFDVDTGGWKAGSAALFDTRTSMQPNVVRVLGDRFTVVDYPGHRRLRTGLFPHLREAATVVVVVDSVTIHDDRHEGAFAVAELLLSALTSPDFFGVRRLLFVCAKRDDMTAYSAKAVQKLLEKAMAASLQSQQGDLAHVDAVVDAKGSVVGRGGKRMRRYADGGHGAGGRSYTLELDENGSFSFEEQLDIPVAFVEVGCDMASGGLTEVPDRISVKSVVDFLTSP